MSFERVLAVAVLSCLVGCTPRPLHTTSGGGAAPGAVKDGTTADGGPAGAGVGATDSGAAVGAAGDAAVSPDQAGPFGQLVVVVPREELGPSTSVRAHDRAAEIEQRNRESVRVRLITEPSGAKVYDKRKLLGLTPLELNTPEHATPLDLVIQRDGYMVLHTRIERSESRVYRFDLTPAKID